MKSTTLRISSSETKTLARDEGQLLQRQKTTCLHFPKVSRRRMHPKSCANPSRMEREKRAGRDVGLDQNW